MADILIDTFDVNGINDEDPVYKLIRKHRHVAYDAPNSKLQWRSDHTKGVLATLIDAYPQDGNVEIDFTAQPKGMRLHVRVIQTAASNRPTDAPEVTAYAKELANLIKQVLWWAPVTPSPDAPRHEWYEYRYQVVVRLEQDLSWDEMILMMGLDKGRDYESLRQGYSRHKQKRDDDEKLSQDVTDL